MMAYPCGRCGAAFPPALALFLLIAVSAPAPAADVNVVLDQAKLVRLPDRVATIVIGNPVIADATVQNGMMVITGKGYGTTNIIALDRSGAVLLETSVSVEGPRANVVVVYKGVERESYSCTPNCERRLTLGDGGAFFELTATQIGARNGLAQGAAPGK
jgi:hypothetical protein